MRRSSATTGLIIKASRVFQETVGVLSESECGASMQVLGTDSRRVASFRMRAARSRSELAIVPLGLVNETNSEVLHDALPIFLVQYRWPHLE